MKKFLQIRGVAGNAKWRYQHIDIMSIDSTIAGLPTYEPLKRLLFNKADVGPTRSG